MESKRRVEPMVGKGLGGFFSHMGTARVYGLALLPIAAGG